MVLEKDLLSPNRPPLSSTTLDSFRDNNEISSLLVQIKDFVLEKGITHIYLVDGFLLYLEPLDSILSSLDLAFFFHAPLDVLLDRRIKRAAYQTPEGIWSDPDGTQYPYVHARTQLIQLI